jgi:subtilase family serine protease
LTARRPPLCYQPRQFAAAYGARRLIEDGIDGAGRTVVLLESAVPTVSLTATDVQQDLSLYERRFDLPAADLEVVSAGARGSSLPLATREELLDVEAVHAVAPRATIRVVLIEHPRETPPAASDGALRRALAFAVDHNLGDVSR